MRLRSACGTAAVAFSLLLAVACAVNAPRSSSAVTPAADTPADQDHAQWLTEGLSRQTIRDEPRNNHEGKTNARSVAGSEFATPSLESGAVPPSVLRMDSSPEGRQLMKAILRDDAEADEEAFSSRFSETRVPHHQQLKLHHKFPRSVLAAHFGGLTNDCCKRYSDKEDKEFCDILPWVRSDTEVQSLATKCLGSYGNSFDCNGVPWINASSQEIEGDALRNVFVSVGSIVHSNCCLRFPRGQMCSEDVTFNRKFADMYWDDKCACAMEWNKARQNYRDGRFWVVKMNPLEDQQVQLVRARPSWTPSAYPVDWRDQRKAARRGRVTETTITRGLLAPAGSKLDCPHTDRRCKPNPNNRNIQAGDSLFCESGVFSEVVAFENTRDGDSGVGYGICAEGPRRPNLKDDPPMKYNKVFLPYKEEGDLREISKEDAPPPYPYHAVKEFKTAVDERANDFAVEKDSESDKPPKPEGGFRMAARRRRAVVRRDVKALHQVQAQLRKVHQQLQQALAHTQQRLELVQAAKQLQGRKVALLHHLKQSGKHLHVTWPRVRSHQTHRRLSSHVRRGPRPDGVVLPAPAATRILPRKKRQSRFKFVRGQAIRSSKKHQLSVHFSTKTVGHTEQQRRRLRYPISGDNDDDE